MAHHTELLAYTGLFAMGCLGMRHALDPDHVATVDGMTFAVREARARLAPWIGAIFALGHGLVVTVIAVAVAFLGEHLPLPASANAFVAWAPMALLLLVGGLNLRALLADEPFRPVSWKAGFLPKGMRDATHPALVLLTGVVFALMLDSIVQAAAWGLAAGAHGGATAALGAGLAFTAGMIVTSAFYGLAMCKFMALADGTAHAMRVRRAVGWFTVVLAFGIVGYAVTTHFVPAIAIDEEAFELLGLPLVGAFGLGWLAMVVLERRAKAAPALEPATAATPTPAAPPAPRPRYRLGTGTLSRV